MGFSLRHIAKLSQTGFRQLPDIAVDHLDILEDERQTLSIAIAALYRIISDDNSEEDLVKIIQLEDRRHSPANKDTYYNRHYNASEQNMWADAKLSLARIFGPSGYDQLWQNLFRRIEQALSLDPKSQKARDFLVDWYALLSPLQTLIGANQLEKSRHLHNSPSDRDELAPHKVPDNIWEFITEVIHSQTLNSPQTDGSDNA